MKIRFKEWAIAVIVSLLIAVPLTLFLQGCIDSQSIEPTGGIKAGDGIVYVYEIDDCEYIGKFVGSTSDVLTHRGRCKFCEQRKTVGDLTQYSDGQNTVTISGGGIVSLSEDGTWISDSNGVIRPNIETKERLKDLLNIGEPCRIGQYYKCESHNYH